MRHETKLTSSAIGFFFPVLKIDWLPMPMRPFNDMVSLYAISIFLVESALFD